MKANRERVAWESIVLDKVLFPFSASDTSLSPQASSIAFPPCFPITSRHAPLLDHAILCDFIDEGDFGCHLRRMCAIYSERLAALLEEADARFAGLLEISGARAVLSWRCSFVLPTPSIFTAWLKRVASRTS